MLFYNYTNINIVIIIIIIIAIIIIVIIINIVYIKGRLSHNIVRRSNCEKLAQYFLIHCNNNII